MSDTSSGLDDASTPRLGDRSLFPDLQPPAYLNHAAISAPSAPVKRRVEALMNDYASHGVGAFGRWWTGREALRARLARLIGAEPGDLGWVSNTTHGIMAVALCYPWDRGDRVVLFDGDFPANVTPWMQAAEEHDLEPVFLDAHEHLDAPDRAMERLEDTLRSGARVVAVSAVAFQTGLRMPLAAMAERCHAHGAELAVDGIQACGIVPVDVEAEGVDYLACGAHKWLMGLEGAGFLYVAPERVEALQPRLAGWTSHEHAFDFLTRGEPGLLRYDHPIPRRASFVEGGVVNNAGLAALDASTELIEHLGVAAIRSHANAYLDALEPRLVERGFSSRRPAEPARRAGILSAAPPEGVDLKALHAGLMERGISCTTPDGLLRFSPSWPNDADRELPRVLEALDEVLAEQGR